jgi:flagellar assembly protein FliH
MSDFDRAQDIPTGFVAGFAARHSLAAPALQRAFAMPEAFAAVDVRDRAAARPASGAPRSFSPQGAGPRHFSPADPGTNPTAGWDPLSADAAAPSSDPVAAARAAGYAEGLAAAQSAVADAGDRDRALLAGLLDQIGQGRDLDRDAIARQLRETVLLLVGKLVGEIGVSADLLAGRIAAAADHLADSSEPALLRVHPDDVALLDGRLPPTLFAAGDPSVARGSFVLESASTIVEDGPALWLEQLEQAVDRVAVPGC